MEKRILTGAAAIACLYLMTAWTGIPAASRQRSSSSSAPAGRILHAQPDFGKMPVNFIPNRGQLDERVAYYIQGEDKTIYFSAEGLTFVLAKTNEERESSGLENQRLDERTLGKQATSSGLPAELERAKNSRWVVKLDFLGANPDVNPVGADETGTVISYFRGRPGNWKTGLPAYSRIIYSNLWPGIDLVYSGSRDKLKYEFIVHPGANPSRIRLAYRGASSVLRNKEGCLAVSTPSGGFEDGLPLAYQEDAGKRLNVALAYKIADNGDRRTADNDFGETEGGSVEYGFEVGTYDQTKALILDPVILTYCGYVGGPSYDYGYGIAADSKGCAYITGYTYSMGTAFPVAAGPDLTFNGGSADAFVAKLNAAGTAFEYCGYIGGSGNDYGYGIAVDLSGNAYVTGYTNSMASTFPVLKGPYLTYNGLMDVFVAKVKADGTALDYCGYIGGSDNDYGRSIAVDGSGNAYVTGYTSSTASTFPVSTGPYLIHNGLIDVFVAKVKADGTALDYCGYIGGSGNDYGYGIALDLSGNAYVTGATASTEATFPVLTGPYLTHFGLMDVFVAKVKADGTALDYCGYIGGSGNDYGYGIAVDLFENAYITGVTSSTATDFPVLGGPDMTYNGGYYDAFVAKINAGGTSLSYCGYIGGAGYDAGTGIAVDGWGDAYITGYTSSKEDSFPVKGGPSLTNNGSFDAFVAEVDEVGENLMFCGYIGGADSDLGMGVALDADGSGNIFLTGNTYSNESSFPVIEGPELSYSGSRDGFLAKIYNKSIILKSPNGGESWHVGFTENITWRTTGQMGNVRIEYSTDSGTTWIEIEASTENDGTQAWLVPDTVSDTCLMRISEADFTDFSDTSNATFTITDAPMIIVTSPNSEVSWMVGSTHDITWVTGGTVGNVKIDYTTDFGTTWIEIVASTENNGTYAWIVPNTVSNVCLVRISEADDGDPSDVSDAPFAITGTPSISLTSPNGGEIWQVGSTHDITWVTGGTVGNVKIESTTDGGTTWTEIVASTENVGTYTWLVPDAASNTCLVRISEAEDGDPSDASDAAFTITHESIIIVTSPNGGESWQGGSRHDITWVTGGTVGNVKIESTTDGGTTWIEIVASTENDGTYAWLVPNAASNTCLVRISEADDGDPSDASDAPFAITGRPFISLTSPNGGEIWQGGSTHDITWVTGGTVGNVKIDYTTDGGTTWTEIVASTENNGTYAWIVPNAASNKCLMRISEASDGDPSDTSDSMFFITTPRQTKLPRVSLNNSKSEFVSPFFTNLLFLDAHKLDCPSQSL